MEDDKPLPAGLDARGWRGENVEYDDNLGAIRWWAGDALFTALVCDECERWTVQDCEDGEIKATEWVPADLRCSCIADRSRREFWTDVRCGICQWPIRICTCQDPCNGCAAHR